MYLMERSLANPGFFLAKQEPFAAHPEKACQYWSVEMSRIRNSGFEMGKWPWANPSKPHFRW